MNHARAKTYYQILEVPTNSSVQTIKRALRDLRRQDNGDDFHIVLKNIEHVLLDAKERENYDNSVNLLANERVDYSRMNEFIPREEQGDISKDREKFRSFFDLGEDEKEEEESEQDNLRFSPYARSKEDIDKENSQLSFNYSMQKSHIKMLVIIGIFLLIGAVVYKPIRTQWTGQEQSKQAVEALKSASKILLDYVKTNKVFPTTLPEEIKVPEGSFYDLRLEKEGTNNAIVLTFNDNAISTLQNNSLKYKTHVVPNLGLSWYCVSNSEFPSDYLPGTCKSTE